MNSILLGLAMATCTSHPPVPYGYPAPAAIPYASYYQASPAFLVPHRPHVLTLDQFSRVFRPTQGHHQVWLIHPMTGRPVEVCFDLPHGMLRDFEVNHRSIEFVFQTHTHRHFVTIHFHHNGTVDVRSH